MLIPFSDLVGKYNMKIDGVVHVGAHLGEEAEAYAEIGVDKVLWIEGNPDLMAPLNRHLSQFPGQRAVCTLISDKDGDLRDFNITNNGMSSSLLPFGTHPQQAPDVWFIETKELTAWTLDTTLDTENFWTFNMLNLDLQGAELLCLKGATTALRQVDYIYTEVNENYLYEGCVLMPELDEFLSEFERVETKMTTGEWGDALYVRKQ